MFVVQSNVPCCVSFTLLKAVLSSVFVASPGLKVKCTDCKQPIIVLYFVSETVLKFNLEAWSYSLVCAFDFVVQRLAYYTPGTKYIGGI